MPLIRSWYWSEHCKKYWNEAEDPRCERHSFVCRDEVGTVRTNRGEESEEYGGSGFSIAAINNGTTRPDENIVSVVHRDVVANRAFDVASVDGAEDGRLARIFGDEGDRDGGLWTYGENLG